MDFLTGFGGSLSGALVTALGFLFALTVVVFVHEMGHFLVARWCGVTVKAFSIGFGRELFAWEDSYGTRWRIAAIPLGGYVKFLDDEGVASQPSAEALETLTPEQRAGAFQLKPLWQKAAVVAAGPIANFIFAIVVFAVYFWSNGISEIPPQVGKVMPGTPAATAGFKSGDRVVAIDGTTLRNFSDLQYIVSTSIGRELRFSVERDGNELQLIAVPELREFEDSFAGKHERPVIGIGAPDAAVVRPVGFAQSFVLGGEQTWRIIAGTLSYLRDVFAWSQSPNQIGGIVRIADTAGKFATLGFSYLVYFTAALSVSIGLVNLFPIPVLDGGHLMFYALEALRGRPLSEQTQEMFFRVGLAVILMLMVFGFYNDRGILAKWFS